jgi:hypothetical protein
MAAEQIVNNAASFLLRTLAPTDTLIYVTDPSTFPTTGQFRVVVGSEIMLVTAVAGAGFTVQRGTEGTLALPHNQGDVVTHIITKSGLETWARDNSHPEFNNTSGYPFRLVNSSGTALTSSDFTWRNQGSVVVTDVGRSMVFKSPTVATTQRRMFYRAQTAPYTVTVAIAGTATGTATSPQWGMGVYDSTNFTSKDISFEGNLLAGHDFGGDTTLDGTLFNAGSTYQRGNTVWFQIEDDNVDHFFRVSYDGVTWHLCLQETRTTQTAVPGNVGIYLNNLNSGNEMMTTCFAWVEE